MGAAWRGGGGAPGQNFGLAGGPTGTKSSFYFAAMRHLVDTAKAEGIKLGDVLGDLAEEMRG